MLTATSIEKIEQFINCYDDCEEPKKILEQLYDAAISSPEADIWTSDNRSDMVLFRRQIINIMDALFSIGPPLIQVHKK